MAVRWSLRSIHFKQCILWLLMIWLLLPDAHMEQSHVELLYVVVNLQQVVVDGTSGRRVMSNCVPCLLFHLSRSLATSRFCHIEVWYHVSRRTEKRFFHKMMCFTPRSTSYRRYNRIYLAVSKWRWMELVLFVSPYMYNEDKLVKYPVSTARCLYLEPRTYY